MAGRGHGVARASLAALLVLGVACCATFGNAPDAQTGGNVTVSYPEPSFDGQVSSAMRARAERIAVSLDSPVNVAALPAQLDRWIEAVSDSGGHVYMCRQPAAASGATIEDLLDWVVKNTVFEVRTLYLTQPAKYYDVFLMTSRNQITTVVFAIRDAGSHWDAECKSLLSEFAAVR